MFSRSSRPRRSCFSVPVSYPDINSQRREIGNEPGKVPETSKQSPRSSRYTWNTPTEPEHEDRKPSLSYSVVCNLERCRSRLMPPTQRMRPISSTIGKIDPSYPSYHNGQGTQGDRPHQRNWIRQGGDQVGYDSIQFVVIRESQADGN